MNDAGRIGFVIKGDYSSSTTYEFLDVVYYRNATYIARKTTTGVLPTVTTDWFCAMNTDIEGLVHVAVVNPNGTEYGANWLMKDGVVLTPQAEDIYRVLVGGKERMFFWNGTQYETLYDNQINDNQVSENTTWSSNKIDNINNALDGRLDTVEDDIIGLQDKTDLLTEKRYIFIGDSYNTTDTPSGGTQIVPWSSYLDNYLSGVKYHSGVSGSGFASGTKTFLDQLVDLSATISDKDKITDIVVLGGVNDGDKSYSAIINGIISFADYAAANYPNAMITVGMISGTRNWVGKQRLMSIVDYYNSYSAPNYRHIDNAYTFYHNYNEYQSDDHPLPAGSRRIAHNVANFLNYGASECSLINSGSVDLSKGEFTLSSGNINLLENTANTIGSITLISSYTFIFSAAVQILTFHRYKLGEMPTAFVRPIQTGSYLILGEYTGWLYDNPNYIKVVVELSVYNQDLYIMFKDIDTTTAESVAKNNIIRFYMGNQYFNKSIPLLLA